MNITRRWCDLEFYLDATSVPIPCEDAKAREVSKTAASAPSRESRYEGGRRLEQTAGAGGRDRGKEQTAGAEGRSRRQGQAAKAGGRSRRQEQTAGADGREAVHTTFHFSFLI